MGKSDQDFQDLFKTRHTIAGTGAGKCLSCPFISVPLVPIALWNQNWLINPNNVMSIIRFSLSDMLKKKKERTGLTRYLPIAQKKNLTLTLSNRIGLNFKTKCFGIF